MVCPSSIVRNEQGGRTERASYFEQDVVKAPRFRGEDGREAEFAPFDEEREVHSA